MATLAPRLFAPLVAMSFAVSSILQGSRPGDHAGALLPEAPDAAVRAGERDRAALRQQVRAVLQPFSRLGSGDVTRLGFGLDAAELSLSHAFFWAPLVLVEDGRS